MIERTRLGGVKEGSKPENAELKRCPELRRVLGGLLLPA